MMMMIPKRAKISRRSERFFASLFTLFFSTLLLGYYFGLLYIGIMIECWLILGKTKDE